MHENKPLDPLTFRRQNRRIPTSAENNLWRVLRGRALEGRKFRRQHTVGPYTVDFYCHEERLVIELDGAVHDDPTADVYDLERTRYLEQQGLRVLRFWNSELRTDLEAVLEKITSCFRSSSRIDSGKSL